MFMGIISVRCNKCECRNNIRAGASGNQIDTSNDALIYLFLASKIRVESFDMRDRVEWVTRAIRIHIRELVDCVYVEAMVSEFCERLFTEVNSHISVFACNPIKSCS